MGKIDQAIEFAFKGFKEKYGEDRKLENGDDIAEKQNYYDAECGKKYEQLIYIFNYNFICRCN